MNCPWFRNPAVASSIVMPAGSIAVSRASCCGFFASFVETAFGRAVVVAAPVLPVVAVDPVVVPDAGAVVPPAVAVVPDVVPDVLADAATGFPFDLAPAEAPRPLDAVAVVVVLVEVGVVVFAGAPWAAVLPLAGGA
jgi:hypothetical protein